MLVLLSTSVQADSIAVAGVLDLSNTDLAGEGPIDLAGQWLTYWGRLLGPENLQLHRGADPVGHDGVFDMPHTWNEWNYQGEPVGGSGHATFVLVVHLPSGVDAVGLWVPNASTSYRLWANGSEVASNGVVGESAATSRPQYITGPAYVPVDGSRLDLVLQVSNYHHRRGGMWKPIRLGTTQQIARLDTTETTYDLVLLVAFLSMFLYNLAVSVRTRYLPRQTVRGIATPALLACIFAALALRVLVTGQILATRALPNFPWELQLRIEYVTAHVVFLAFVWIADRAFPGVVDRPIVVALSAFAGANAVMAVTAPVIVYSRVVFTYVAVTLVVFVGMAVTFLVHALRRKRAALVMVAAILVFLVTTLSETIHYREVLLSRDFAPLGFLFALAFGGESAPPVALLVSTLLVHGASLAILNVLVVRVSRSLLRRESNITPITAGTLGQRYEVTARESAVLQLVAIGKNNRQIGAELSIPEDEVRSNLDQAMRKLDIGSRGEIAIRLRAPEPHEVP